MIASVLNITLHCENARPGYYKLKYRINIPGRWHFYIATVQTDEAVHVERLLKNMATQSDSQGLATHES